MVERAHCHIKAAIAAYSKAWRWFYHLPMFLLGIRTFFKVDIFGTTAKVLHCQPLCLSGEFFAHSFPPNLPFQQQTLQYL